MNRISLLLIIISSVGILGESLNVTFNVTGSPPPFKLIENLTSGTRLSEETIGYIIPDINPGFIYHWEPLDILPRESPYVGEFVSQPDYYYTYKCNPEIDCEFQKILSAWACTPSRHGPLFIVDTCPAEDEWYFKDDYIMEDYLLNLD